MECALRLSEDLLKIFRYRKGPEDLFKISMRIETLIDDVVMRTLKVHQQQLISKPATYIVPAVWGAIKEGALDRDQTAMHKRFSPAIRTIFGLLDLNGSDESQVLAVEYLVRSLIISKIMYMTEFYKIPRLIDSAEISSRPSRIL